MINIIGLRCKQNTWRDCQINKRIVDPRKRKHSETYVIKNAKYADCGGITVGLESVSLRSVKKDLHGPCRCSYRPMAFPSKADRESLGGGNVVFN